jgi:hypothetical protein
VATSTTTDIHIVHIGGAGGRVAYVCGGGGGGLEPLQPGDTLANFMGT